MRRLLLLIAAAPRSLRAAPTRRQAAPGLMPSFLLQTGSIPLNGVEGRIDHFGFDATRQRLFVAALGNDTVEVVDLRVGRVIQQIKKLRAPQDIGFAPKSDRVAVANDEDGSVRL